MCERNLQQASILNTINSKDLENKKLRKELSNMEKSNDKKLLDFKNRLKSAEKDIY